MKRLKKFRKTLHIASWSGGKDSTATIILAHEHNEPLDLIIFAEVMFNESISGELPEHINFIHKTKKTFEEWGYKVLILHSDRTYLDCFNHVVLKSKNPDRVGKKVGFPMSGRCVINRDCKMRPIRKFWKSMDQEFIQYVGIADGEDKRLDKIERTKNTVSLLKKYGYTEADAYNLCLKYNLLSPVYSFTDRGGCWFCPNARIGELRHIRDNHRGLWNTLLELEKEENIIGCIWNTLKKKSLHDWEKEFQKEDNKDPK